MVTSAGILLYRRAPALEVLIAHMGGPFWARKDAGAWSLPKGEYDPADEEPWDAAVREFHEELGVAPPDARALDLGVFTVSSSKKLAVYALDGSGWEPGPFAFGEFELEWPPRSGKLERFPEVDRAEWSTMDAARIRLVKGQLPILDVLERLV
ncbi:NUDIX domain-containing protein [Microbacterium sp. ASV49]|uniref:NUDIX domain-containing protein n=1 Tax=Microbacterium candidum TaxID=3041922 RepID=A0ABT7MY48_9MICO|nr:NUDIX domain-containing protein [Microbacterium sp. ASV49]MDL9979371.1 NUDIX domain-containing protein [Microbacterium sp. ASV49]